jgi:hypothetical protein
VASNLTYKAESDHNIRAFTRLPSGALSPDQYFSTPDLGGRFPRDIPKVVNRNLLAEVMNGHVDHSTFRHDPSIDLWKETYYESKDRNGSGPEHSLVIQ